MTEQDRALRACLDGLTAQAGIPRYGVCRIASLSRLGYARRADSRLAQGSAVVFLLPYFAGVHPGRNIALYAAADDYHTVFTELASPMLEALRGLFPGALFAAFADASPIPEKEAACRCGLGFCGRNQLLISDPYGSFCFLGEILTDLELTPDEEKTVPSGCGDCRRCIRACPTGALSEAGFALERCVSRVTQLKGELTPEQREMLRAGGSAWGCDLCQLACPHNRALPTTKIEGFRRNLAPTLTPENIPALIGSKPWGWKGAQTVLRNLSLLSGASSGPEPGKMDPGGAG